MLHTLLTETFPQPNNGDFKESNIVGNIQIV